METMIINVLIKDILPIVNNEQARRIKTLLEVRLSRYKIIPVDSYQSDNDNNNLLKKFLDAKSIEGCSNKTVLYYRNTIQQVINTLKKSVTEISTDDLRDYLTTYQNENHPSQTTVDNIRRILSSFYAWLEDEEYILKSPVRRIHKVKTQQKVKETYSDENLELMRDNCKEPRDLAMIDLLASTGMRVGEMVLLNRGDINFNDRECIVLGKGNKERIVYFNARCKIHLKNYIDSRSDTDEALFVSLKTHKRISIGGVESRLRKLGKELGINRVHPHKFRRTLATQAIDKGMPIEQVQQLLGHKRIDTTLQYALVKQSNVKIAHKKFIG
ncbi:site-specific tyrosine recombinase/integron integrase [Succinivibrio sp.]|uniref:site-specific tyrosine recombinase/integron integrase n=1 Tax=Succinivibrio sp. TaxID=2053619 RepID=UPI0025F31AD4|nr:site-specific tyrosine recombinase/integron integrase [Succinivibrio sp.]MBQ9221495.1 tyrosine-type recombinase/integrase [Succinivibrio sp.]